MELEIKDKVRELRFGIGFVRKLDMVYNVDAQGTSFGIGLAMAIEGLEQYSPTVLAEVVRCASSGNPTLRDVDNALEDYAEENEGLGGLFEEVEEELGKSFVVKDTIKKMSNMMK